MKKARLDLGEGVIREAVRLSDELQIYKIADFLSLDEIEHFAALYAKRRPRSTQRYGGHDEPTRGGLVLNMHVKDNDAVQMRVRNRIARLLRVSRSSLSFERAMEYSTGNFAQAHFDASPKWCRASTALLYLTTVDEAHGGATRFPELKCPIQIQPVAGTVLVWDNYLLAQPDKSSVVNPLSKHEGTILKSAGDDVVPRKLAMTIWSNF